MNKLITNIKETKDKITRRIAGVAMNAKAKLEDTRGSVSEHAIVIIIGVVLGGLLLTGLIALMMNGLPAKKWRRYDRSYDARAEARAAAMLQERESAKPRYTQAKLRIVVVGAQPRIGATSYAIRLAAYFRSCGAEAAVICTDPRRDMQLDMLCDICDGTANSNGSYTIHDIDFYASTAADIGDCAVAIYDCGDIAGVLHSFGDFDKLYLVGGTSWSELPMIYQAQTELNAANYTAVINFSTPEHIKCCHDILSLNLNDVICAPFEPNAFAFAAYEDIFDKMFDSCRDVEQTEDEAAEEY